MSTIRITTLSQVHAIADSIADASRVVPIVVITAGDRGFNFELDRIDDELGSNAVVYSCDQSALVNALAVATDRNLVAGPGLAVVFGAGSLGDAGFRVSYAPQVDTLNGVRRATNRIIGEARTMAYNAGLFDRTSESAVAVTCVVKQLFAGSAMVQPEPIRGVSLPPLMSLLESTTYPGVPLSWYLEVGQVVTGVWDPETRNFTLDKSDWTETDLVGNFPYGSVTLAMFTEVNRQGGTVVVHPALPMAVTKQEISSNPVDVIDRLFSVDDIVRVRVYRDPQGRTRVRMDDIDDTEETLPAISLVPGGTPWLEQEHNAIIDRLLESLEVTRESDDRVRLQIEAELHQLGINSDIDVMLTAATATGDSDNVAGHAAGQVAGGVQSGDVARGEPQAVELLTDARRAHAMPVPGPGRIVVASTTAAVVPGAATPDPVITAGQYHLNQFAMKRLRADSDAQKRALEKVKAQIDDLTTALSDAQRTIALMTAERKDLRAKLSDFRNQVSKLGRETSTTASRRERFATDDDWITEEIRRHWISAYAPADRKVHNIETEKWTLGPGFADSFAALDAGEQRKALRVIVNIVTRRSARDNIHTEHALRTGAGATASDRVRPNGDACWRVHLEKGVPQAKRLHYWRRRDGHFELAQIADHDNFDA